MAMARVVRIVASLSVLLVFTAHGAKSAASPEELRELRAKIERLQRDLATAESSRSGAVDQLRESEKAVSEAHRALFVLAQERGVIEAELEAIAAREREARASVAGQQALAERLLRLQYQQGATDRLRLALEGRDAAEVARRIAYYGYIQRARAEVIGVLRNKAERLEALELEARGRRDALAANHDSQEGEARVLERERAARAAVVQRLAGDVAKGQREIGRLKRDEARLSRLVEEIARALAKTEPKSKAPGRVVDRVADASLAAKPFASLKGRLKLPVRGELVNQFGTPREESGAPWKGLFIRSITGETVHAIADGRVVYADWLRGFGNLLIVDHGEGYMSLYANNEGLLRQVGETVRSGDPVAHVGASGGHEESGLYFELRRDGKPFDPMKWVVL